MFFRYGEVLVDKTLYSYVTDCTSSMLGDPLIASSMSCLCRVIDAQLFVDALVSNSLHPTHI